MEGGLGFSLAKFSLQQSKIIESRHGRDLLIDLVHILPNTGLFPAAYLLVLSSALFLKPPVTISRGKW